MGLPFATSPRSTVGIEWELAIVDADTGDLRQVARPVLDALAGPDGSPHPHVHQELLLNTVELVTGVHETVAGAARDLADNLAEVRDVVEPLRADLMCAGTHPFAQSDHQRVTDQERYNTLIERTQWWGRQMLIYGVHVHVGIEDRAKVLPLVRAVLAYYGHMQALSASSPFWGGRETGYASNRALMFQQLPTAGLPFRLDEWSDLERYTSDMLHTGVIDDFSEIRWDVRPSPRFGTVEVRVCDGLPSLLEVRAIAAFTQCLVEHFSAELDAGRPLPDLPQWFLQENKWRSARYGMDAILVLDADANEDLVTTDVRRMLEVLAPAAERLKCSEDLAAIEQILDAGASYQRQREVARRSGGDLQPVVFSLVEEMRAGRPLL
ncbi:carboxylate-amine ligase [Mumia flava]|uniref:Putative glutamate--cysteine ligase 2 n=1 Tax=Mumia flava TaxID=1348852 RepID=A0A0B2BKX0_9ACTN|nr:glutamate--cysteine ligase [Mumia flava]PJJ56411.1 carboxylate-amine ligase [Mumia flava]